ncbi:MAG: CHAD domain-containing protein [Prochloraceae cyanobacterium]|nr:CHAD domain-containing protein [Prochloraceae cyanobacterium]
MENSRNGNCNTTFGNSATIAIAKHLEKMLARETGVILDRDPEELHQMRVSMRRLRSAITGFAPALSLPKTASDRNVGKIARILGKLRDIDVLQAELQDKYQPLLPQAEQKSLEKALKILAKKRKLAYQEVTRTFKRKAYQDLKKDLNSWLEKPQYQQVGNIGIERVLPDLLSPQVGKFLLHPGWWLGIKAGQEFDSAAVETILEREEAILHDLRKEAKRSRYNMELFTDFYGDSYQKYVKKIKKVQEVLGEIQDCFILKEFFKELFGSNFEKKLPTLVKLIAEKRYQKWLEWLEIQQEFLKSETRQELRSLVLHPSQELILA